MCAAPALRHVSLESFSSGIVELENDWLARGLPPVEGVGAGMRFRSFRRLSPLEYGRTAGFFHDLHGALTFVLDPARIGEVPQDDDAFYVAGDFNGWGEAAGNPAWRLRPAHFGERPVLARTLRAADFHGDPPPRFKFVSGRGRWIEVPWTAPNVIVDADGNRNHVLNRQRTGLHLFRFDLHAPAQLSENNRVAWKGAGGHQTADVVPGAFFFHLRTDLPLGAVLEKDRTVFRLFAPRARTAEVAVFEKLEDPNPAWIPLKPRDVGVWEAAVPGRRVGWYYWFRLDGPRNAFSAFDPAVRILDPWALAAAASAGPAIVVDRAAYPPPKPFTPPHWHELIICEAHVRDLVARAPLALDPEERLGFRGLVKWVDHRAFHLARLGVNAVELQPVQEFDNRRRDEYHWGYMPTAWLAPEGDFASDPARGTQVAELREVVDAFHRRGMAVIADVVYNHMGEPNALHAIDKLLYLELNPDGSLTNWSGCGNDVRCASAMTRRLILDSLVHLMEFHGIDGFRFDLAELLGVDALREFEAELKRRNPRVILIAEPWSFRGHIAGALRSTGFASWNDGYRDFVREYVLGRGDPGGIEYYLKGSPWHFASFPAQTVNYTESHDDRTWIDRITVNPDGNGFRPAGEDVRRTHLMLAILFASLGIPMIAAGQDFLRSKRGVTNTYLRGDLNALDYHRVFRFPATHEFACRWIRLRRSPEFGPLLCPWKRPEDGFFRFHSTPGRNAVVAHYNADGTAGPRRLLLALNPHDEEVSVALGASADHPWRQLCDQDGFFDAATLRAPLPVTPDLEIPPLGCAAWVV